MGMLFNHLYSKSPASKGGSNTDEYLWVTRHYWKLSPLACIWDMEYKNNTALKLWTGH